MKDAGIGKTLSSEKLIACRVQTFNEGNVEFALKAKQTIENWQATLRLARVRKNQIKKELREYFRKVEWKNHKPYPLPGDEGDGNLGV